MADAVIVAQHGHAAFGGDAIDQRASAARHDQVEPVHGLQELAHGGAVGGGHELHAIGRQPGGSQRPAQAIDDGAR